MTTIKITELTNIGANLASTTVFPVVNMSGTPTTEKTVLGNIANVILSGAGGNYVAVGAATLAGTVTTNAQPNITSTGSLTGLTVSNAAGTVNFSNTANVTLGAVGNLHIAGGTAGQLLSTNGNGTLSWASDTTTYGNSNVVSLMASFGSNTITTTGNVSVGNIIGNGQALTNIAGANVSGTVSDANLSQYLNVSDVNNNFSYHVVLSAGSGDKSLHIDADDNLQYNPADGTLTATRVDATYVLADLQFSNGYPAANITGLGNIATINLSGSNSNVLYGNGVFAAVAGGANTGNVTFNDINIIGTGNLNLQPNSATGESLDIYLTAADDIHIAGSGNVILGTDEQANVAVLTNGNVAIQAGNVSGTQTWNFGTDGNLTLPRGGVVYETNIPDGGLNGNTIALKPSGGTNTDQQLLIYPTTNDANHLHLTSGNLYSTELFLGDDNLYVKLANTGNVVINSNDGAGNTAQWTLDTTGNLTLPDTTSVLANVSITLEANDTGNITGLSVNGDSDANLYAHSNVTIVSDSGNTTATWNFDETGNLTVPGDLIGPASANFTIYSNAGQHNFTFADDGTFYAPDDAVLGGNTIYIGPGANTLTGLAQAVMIASSNHSAYIQAVINNVSDNGSADWVAQGRLGDDNGGWADFGFTSGGFNDANYTITGPGDGYLFVESYAPGQLITGPKGGNLILATGEQGTVRDIIFGTGGFLSSNIFGRISHANNSLELSRAGATITFPDATEQNTAWTGSVTTIANGNSNVNIATSNGNIVITSAGTNGWNFDSTGNLTIPGSSGGFIKTVANASIGIVAVDNGTNNPAQLLSMTNAGAATSIISAYATNATIQTNATGTLNTWQFDNAGNLTLPTGGQIIVSGGLVSSGASPAPTINGFSITNSAGISGNGNIAGNNISATGNVTAQGVGTNMVRRANTISGSNTAVTLDNLTALVGGTPKRLYIGAATSNMTMAGQSQTMSTGALAVSSWINVPIVTGTGNGFAMSGAITNDGDTAVLNVTDQGAGSGTWRVTGMIANTSANLYSVSIERLA